MMRLSGLGEQETPVADARGGGMENTLIGFQMSDRGIEIAMPPSIGTIKSLKVGRSNMVFRF